MIGVLSHQGLDGDEHRRDALSWTPGRTRPRPGGDRQRGETADQGLSRSRSHDYCHDMDRQANKPFTVFMDARISIAFKVKNYLFMIICHYFLHLCALCFHMMMKEGFNEVKF